MKNLLRNLIPLIFLAMPGWVAAQSDDLYYDPSQDAVLIDADFTSYDPAPVAQPSNRETLPAYEGDYDDYSYWDDQGYFYTSRIRRFHQPYQGFNYYDPIYTDVGFYDPWMMPGSSIYITHGGFNDYGNWRRMNRWRMYDDWMVWRGWNSFNSRYYMDPWSFNSWGAFRVYDPWFDPYWGGACFNTGWNRGWGNGNNYFNQNNFYNQPGYWFGNSNGTVESNDPTNRYFGPRNADARTGPSRGTLRNPEYVGGGIPRLRDVVGNEKAPATPTQGSRGQEAGTDPERNNGQVRKPDASTVKPNPQNNDPSTVKDRVRNETPVTDQGARDPRVPQTDNPVRGEQPARGTITPAQPERRDPLAERRRWSDMDNDQPQRPATDERSRDTYRDDYIRQRENDRRPSTPQTNPRDRNNFRPLERPSKPDSQAPAKKERPRPAPVERERTAPSRRDNSGANEAPSRSFESPSRSFESPGRSNSNSGGGVDRGNSKSSGSSSGSSPKSGSGRRGE